MKMIDMLNGFQAFLEDVFEDYSTYDVLKSFAERGQTRNPFTTDALLWALKNEKTVNFKNLATDLHYPMKDCSVQSCREFVLNQICQKLNQWVTDGSFFKRPGQDLLNGLQALNQIAKICSSCTRFVNDTKELWLLVIQDLKPEQETPDLKPFLDKLRADRLASELEKT